MSRFEPDDATREGARRDGSASADDPRRAVRMAYLVSQYPAVSHTFIHREVRRLGEFGVDIDVASINAPDRSFDKLPTEEQEEARRTFYVKGQGSAKAVAELLRMTLFRPVTMARGLRIAASLGWKRPKALALHFFYLVEAILIFRWLEKRHHRHLHVHFGTQAATVGLILARTFSVPFSLTVHGPDEFYDVEAHHLAEKIRTAGLICCIGFYARSQLMKLSPPGEWRKLHIAPLGVDSEIFSARAYRARPEPFEIVCVGRLVPAKGQQILVQAAALLVGDGRNIQLHFVGDGPDRGSLERIVRSGGMSGHVIFHGAVNQDRIRDFLERADVFVLASFAEGIPVALMEAMSMEIPCVSTRINGIPELIREGVDGLLVAPSDERELASAIGRLIDDPELRRRLGTAGRRRVLSHYHLGTNVERLAEILREYVSGSDGPRTLGKGEV